MKKWNSEDHKMFQLDWWRLLRRLSIHTQQFFILCLVRCKAQCCSVMGTKFLSCCLKQLMAINTNLVVLCCDENVVEMRGARFTLHTVERRCTRRDQPCSVKACTFGCMWCFLHRPLFDFPKISVALCLAALALYSGGESGEMTESCRGLFKVLSRHCLVLRRVFLE